MTSIEIGRVKRRPTKTSKVPSRFRSAMDRASRRSCQRWPLVIRPLCFRASIGFKPLSTTKKEKKRYFIAKISPGTISKIIPTVIIRPYNRFARMVLPTRLSLE